MHSLQENLGYYRVRGWLSKDGKPKASQRKMDNATRFLKNGK